MLAVIAIGPTTISNALPAPLTLSGTSFADGVTVAIGGQTLVDVKVQSATVLTATLPTGLCPGTYAASISDRLGREASGGQLVVLGKRTATLSGSRVAGPPITLNGKPRTVTALLPSVLIEDTTCAGDDWRLAFSVSDFTQGSADRGALVPRSIQLTSPGVGRRTEAPLTPRAGRGETVLVVPHAREPGVTVLSASTEIDIPSHPEAGEYTSTVVVMLEATP